MHKHFLETSHSILWITVIFVITAIVWANYAMLDEVTRSSGKVIPSQQVQVIQNLEGGIIAEILVKEGNIVEQGQVLLRIDDTRFAVSVRENQLTSTTMKAKIARLTTESKGKQFKLSNKLKKQEIFKNEQALAELRQQELQANIDVLIQQKKQKQHEIKELKSRQKQLQHSYNLAQQELKIVKPLVKKGVISEVDLLRLQREISDLKAELDGIKLSVPRIEAAISEAKRKIAEVKVTFRTNALTELNDIKAELLRISESKRTLEDRVTRTAVRSPVKGTVKQIKVNTIGGVVQPGMDLMEIVPLEDTLLVEAQIRPSDIAFLHPGQQAMVKFTAYDFSIFGGLQATLEHISADSIANERGEAFFLIRLRTTRNYLGNKVKSLPIISGMTVEVDILTGKKSLLSYLLKPIKKAQQKALRER
ncbi:HlyD family type I secretion periplasmic adaptor subunit [Candidatus Halobeggiatoa sp. HSG11]|nr:HlyD family type I secretion periplasmic adaptor subunit [Candidatus Halobeggiatoa sp. HSG11]